MGGGLAGGAASTSVGMVSSDLGAASCGGPKMPVAMSTGGGRRGAVDGALRAAVGGARHDAVSRARRDAEGVARRGAVGVARRHA